MEEVIKSKKPFSPRASYTVAFKAQVIDDYSSDWWYEHQINRPFVQLDTPDILLSNTGDIDQDNELDLELSAIDQVIAESRAWEMERESHIQDTISSVSSEDYEIELNEEIFAL
jgi:hypothetical protein